MKDVGVVAQANGDTVVDGCIRGGVQAIARDARQSRPAFSLPVGCDHRPVDCAWDGRASMPAVVIGGVIFTADVQCWSVNRQEIREAILAQREFVFAMPLAWITC